MILLVFKQPNANVISTADGVRAALPALKADFPPTIHLNVVSDRTLTIRASVQDVAFTLMLSICLVVMVIFVFLRNVWATVIPSVTMPVALVGTLGAMYILRLQPGQSLADGADDRGRLRRRRRDRHAGKHLPPRRRRHEADRRGDARRRRIGFTIVSISFSLIAVFIPLLLMGGIVGRLFREFAICVSITIVVSALVSLTLTPMMCARFLTAEAHEHGRIYS